MTPQEEYAKDLQARRTWHKMCNYHYLSYKGIQLLNHAYSREVLESLGLQIHIPRTFMTIETIRPDLRRPIDITCKPRNFKEKLQADKAGAMLKGEWRRSESSKEAGKCKFDALLFGSGYFLDYYELDEEETDIFSGYDKDGHPTYEKGMQKNYEGMKIKWLNPYYVIPDRKAKTYEHGENTSPRHIWVASIWDFDVWKDYCKKKGFKETGEKGGQVEEYDAVKRQIDAIYTRTLTDLKTRDSGVLPQTPESAPSPIEDDNAIFVVTKYTPTETTTYAGANWTEVDKTKNPLPLKRIPIHCVKDYGIPGELEGVGEAEVIRWQQYEENKIHNLMYLQVILNTVSRYGIIEEMLVDPTQAKMSNPLKPIRLKYMSGAKVSDAIQLLDKGSSTDVPINVLEEVKTIGQMATGQSDYNIGAPKGSADTLGEAELFSQAGNKRIKEKIQQMEEDAFVPLLKSWLSAIPQLYTEEIDYLLDDGTNRDVKFLPFNRDFNSNATMVAKYAVKEGVMDAQTLEDVYLKLGYSDVVFVSDLIGSYDLVIKTALGFTDRLDTIRQYQTAIQTAIGDNTYRMQTGMTPIWDVSKLTEELLRQFDEIIDDVEEYKLQQMPTQPMGVPGSVPPGAMQGAPPGAMPNLNESITAKPANSNLPAM